MNNLSPALMAEMFGQESDDPFLMLITLSHPSFSDIRLVNNTVDITSRGHVFEAFPFKVKLPVDDGETARQFDIEFSNVSLELIDAIRTVTTPIGVLIEMILASIPNDVQISQGELQIEGINYNATTVSAKIVLDNFLTTEMTSERYTPLNFPGLYG